MNHEGPFRPGDSCDEYQIVGSLGKGGFGTVYEAVQPFKISLKDGTAGVGRRVALKCLQLDQAVREDQVERLKKEALLLMHLQHPNIVSVIDAGTAPGGIVYFVMERLYGASLREAARRERPMPISRAVYLVSEIGDGLTYASQYRIVHRDLKPENIFVTRADEVKILDFGTARYQAFGAKTTNPLRVPGTPQYMAPEQLEGRPDVDHRADIFALGTIAYELLSGRHPFARPELTYAEVRDRQLSAAPESLHTVNPTVPLYLADVVATAMIRDREKRYQTAKAFVVALRDAARRYEAEVAGANSRSSGSAPPVVVSAAAPKLVDPEQTIPDREAVSNWFASGAGAGFESLRTVPDRVPTELLGEPAPAVPTAPTVLVSDTKSTDTADRAALGVEGAFARLGRFFFKRTAQSAIPGVPTRSRWFVPAFGFAIGLTAILGVWSRSSQMPSAVQSASKDQSAVHGSVAPATTPLASLEHAGTFEKPVQSASAPAAAMPAPPHPESRSPMDSVGLARHDQPATQPSVAAEPVNAPATTKPSSEKKAAPRASSKRESIAVDRLPTDGPPEAKKVRAKAKPATTAPESEFFRTMGDD